MNLHAEVRMRVHTHIHIQTHNSTRKNTLPDWLCGRLLVCVCVCVCACVYLHTLNAAYILPEQALYKPKSAQYTLKKALYTPKSALHTFKKALYTPASALYTLKKALYTPKSALYTLKKAPIHLTQPCTLKKALHTFLRPIRLLRWCNRRCLLQVLRDKMIFLNATCDLRMQLVACYILQICPKGP